MSSSSNGGPPGTRRDFDILASLFERVVDLDVAARRAAIETACADRPDLAREIEALLAAHDQHASADDEPATSVGTTVGAYRLVEKIGAGGMGDVYLAERADGLFDHRVAIKLTRTSLRNGDTARRFRAERQILASLHHPHIVTLLDGGATPAGEAYLVMEHVAGVPITDHCRDHDLSLDARLRLIGQVAHAVQLAHQHGIVHRDLKPANILVTPDGVPKVLDFGVAKLFDADASANETMTRALVGPLTPNYASPEQLRGLPATTASDVYALGVLTWEVITGTRPYDTTGLTLDEVMRIVLDTEPGRPSARLADASSTRRARLTGDLDAIVLKAMSKDPAGRYSSPGEFADDLGRYLSGHPVVAREPSIRYLLRRAAARNKTLVGVAAAALVAIVTALGAAVWQRQQAVRAQARAEQRFNETRQLANTLIFKIHDAVMPLAGSTPVRQTIVSEALTYLEKLDAEASGDPSLQLELSAAYRQIGAILGNPQQSNLGDRDGALAQYTKARDLALPLARRPDATAEARMSLIAVDVLIAQVHRSTQRLAEAVTFAREAVEQAEALYADTNTEQARAQLGSALFGLAAAVSPPAGAIPYWERALAHYEHDLAERPDDARAQRNVALVCKYLGGAHETMPGGRAAAGPLYRRALALDEGRYLKTPDQRQVWFDLAISLSSVASQAEHEGNHQEALDIYDRSLRLRQQMLDSDPKDVLARRKVGYVQMRLAAVELRLGHLERSRQYAGVARATLQPLANDPGARQEFASALSIDAEALDALGDRSRACALFRQAATAFGDTIGDYLARTQRYTLAADQACRDGRPVPSSTD